MPTNVLDEEEIFKVACRIPEAEARDAYVEQVCEQNTEVRARVQLLLGAYLQQPSFLVPKNADPSATLDHFDSAGRIGEQIGPYKLREKIAEGGMGVVYVAEQTEPVRRKVALKIIKPGMATKEVVARFESERQALAMMEHPHIARMIDAGTTDAGQPFFVMELVHGVPIAQYCDQLTMNNRERLQLFAKVCRAVQHAHQKGVIHRDIKPSNVLVADIDGVAVPKVIDFGVAKAVGHKLVDETVYTQFSQMVGTPLYMSPEQANMGVLDIDTRSDVYSLGVLLYELLTGETPVDRETLKKVGFDEFRRIIREDEPPRPSAMVSTLHAQALSTVAAHRHADSRKFGDSLRGELDWIVMKALEKDRDRRYESASAFAADVERHLCNEPIEACPPSTVYRVKKFARRNKGRLLATTIGAALLLIALTAGVSAKLKSDGLARQLTADVEQSVAAARAAIETGDLAVARQRIGEANGRLISAGKELPELTAAVEQLSVEIDDRREQQQRLLKFEELARDIMGKMFKGMKLGGEKQAAQALDLYGVLSDDHWLDRLRASYLSEQQQSMVRQTAYETLLVLADFGVRWGTKREKVKGTTASLQYLEQAEAFHPPTRAFYWVRSECQKLLNNLEEAERDLKLFQSTAATTAFDYFLPGHTAGWNGDLKEAIRSYEAALRIQPDHFNSLFFLAMRLYKVGRTAEATQIWRACLALRPDDIATLINRAILLSEQGEFEEALESINKAIELNSKSNINSAWEFAARASVLKEMGRYEEALIDLTRAVRLNNKDATTYNSFAWFLATCPDKSYRDASRAIELASQAVELAPHDAAVWNTLGVAQYRAADLTMAIDSLTKSEEKLGDVESPENAFFLAMAHWRLGDHDEARHWYEKGVMWMTANKNSPYTELLRFRAEADETLGIGPEAPISKKSDGQSAEAVISSEKTLPDDPPTSSDLP